MASKNKKLKNLKSPKFRFFFRFFLFFGEKDVDRENGVHDVLPGSEFCVQSYLYTKSKKPKNLKTFSLKNLGFFQRWNKDDKVPIN